MDIPNDARMAIRLADLLGDLAQARDDAEVTHLLTLRELESIYDPGLSCRSQSVLTCLRADRVAS
jgi:hypothetical protein